MRMASISLAGLLAATVAGGVRAQPPWLPLDPGRARCSVQDGRLQLHNAALRFEVAATGGALAPVALDNRFTGTAHALAGELFRLARRNGDKLAASKLALEGTPVCEPIASDPTASRAADRAPGVALHARLHAGDGLSLAWRAVLRDGANYVRQELRLEAARDTDIASVTMIDLALPGGRTVGTVDGSPIAIDDRFFGFEHPMARVRVADGRANATLRRALPLRAGVPATYSAVLGVAPPGQLRRGFQAYLENERAHPFRSFLHYNSWYDIGYFTPYNEADALRVIDAYGRELVQARGVKLDSFLFDDGWDDTSRLWQFHAGFPQGFAPLRDAAARYGAAPGIWLSPWGGYGPPREARLKTARAAGYEVDAQGLALSGPKYYPLFHATTLRLLREYGINQFKLDGTGSPDKVTPGSAFDSDFAAALALIDDLRKARPDLYINLTTGTWPSPFWLRSADSIWRGGEDHAFAGTGSDRQRWITYRDADTYGGVVRQGPLFPLNALMLHGLIYARHAIGLNSDPKGDFAAEVHSYFASGTGLQELYVSPDLLDAKQWDLIATAAKWARERADVLRDSHWIGGDPVRGEVYGWASWAPGRAVVALRNPGATEQSFALDVGAALELPAGEAQRWQARPAFGEGEVLALEAGAATPIRLQPYEVKVWDLSPR